MTRPVFRIGAALAALTLVVLTGCQGDSAGTSDTDSTAAGSGPLACGGHYEYVTMLSSIDYFTDAKNGLKAAEQDFGVTTTFSGPTDNDMPGLLQAIDQAIAKKPDGLILLGWDAALIAEIDKAAEAGVPTVLVNTDFPTSKRAFAVGANNTSWGFTMGTMIKEELGGQGKILVVRDPTLTNVAERFEGLKNALADEPGLEIVAEANDGSDTAKATQAVSGALLANPDINAVVALTGVAGPAAATAIREAGLTGKIKVFAVNRDAVVLQGVQDGDITAAFAEHPQVESYDAIALLQAQRCGSLQISNDDSAAGITAMPNAIDSGVSVITQENVDQFLRE